jgi:hypothetical protein
MWRLPQTSGYSYPRVAVIQIDVHLAGEKPDQHATYGSHSNPCTPSVRFLQAVLYVTTFHWLPWSWNRPLHPEEVLATKDRLDRPSSWVTSFLLPCDSPGVGKRDFGPMVTQLHQLTGPITLACDRYVQYLLTGANRTVLNQHRRGLQPWRCRLATYPLPDLPIQLSPLSPNGPARSPF